MFFYSIVISTPLEISKVLWSSAYSIKKLMFAVNSVIQNKVVDNISVYLYNSAILDKAKEIFFYGIYIPYDFCMFEWEVIKEGIRHKWSPWWGIWLDYIRIDWDLVNLDQDFLEMGILLNSLLPGMFFLLMLFILNKVWKCEKISLFLSLSSLYWISIGIVYLYFEGNGLLCLKTGNYSITEQGKENLLILCRSGILFIFIGCFIMFCIDYYADRKGKRVLNSSLFSSYLETPIIITLLTHNPEYRSLVEDQVGFRLPVTVYGVKTLIEMGTAYISLVVICVLHEMPLCNTIISTINLFWVLPGLFVIITVLPLVKLLGPKYISSLEGGKPYGIGYLIHLLEVISLCLRILSLGFRAAANLTTGLFLDMLLHGVLFELLSYPNSVAGLGVLIALGCYTAYHIGGIMTQAYVFMLMSSVYIRDSGY